MYKILVLGDDCIDKYQYGVVDRISPEAPVPIFKPVYTETKPGMAANVVKNLKALGCCVDYLHTENCTKTRLIDTRTKQHVLRIDEDVVATSIHTIPELSLYSAVVISDYCKGTITYELINQIISSSIPVFIDTRKTDLSCMKNAWVKINELEYNKITTKCNNLIVTRGEIGSVAEYYNYFSPAKKVAVVDITGAGDTYLAAFTYSMLKNNNILQAMDFANLAASITVQNIGCYAPTLEEINSL